MVSLISISEDVLVVVLSFLSPPDIRRLAQVMGFYLDYLYLTI